MSVVSMLLMLSAGSLAEFRLERPNARRQKLTECNRKRRCIGHQRHQRLPAKPQGYGTACHQRDGKLVLANIAPQILEVFRITKLDESTLEETLHRSHR
ncbi:MAG: hypothetical protein IFJ96_01595 [Acidobacteria bacterium]|nr:hypothetical protein [Candidatus Sulfomarinibacter sp. MAG AM2]